MIQKHSEGKELWVWGLWGPILHWMHHCNSIFNQHLTHSLNCKLLLLTVMAISKWISWNTCNWRLGNSLWEVLTNTTSMVCGCVL